MRCPNPICRVVFEVREDGTAPAKADEVYRFEGEPPTLPAAPPETNKSIKTGTVSEVVPLLDAFTPVQPSSVPSQKSKPEPKNGDATPPAPQRVASWRDEPPAPRSDEAIIKPETPNLF